MASTSMPTSFPPGYAEENHSGALYGVAIAFIIIEILFVSLRYFGRYVTNARIGPDDILMIPATIFVVAAAALCIALIEYGGAGRHTDVIVATQPQTYSNFNKIQFALTIIYFLAVTFPKLAIISLMLRIFPQKSFRLVCYGIVGVLIAAALINIILCCLLCMPIAALWDTSIENAKCLDADAYYKWTGLPNVITDFVMLVLPIPYVAKLNLTLGTKVSLIATFATGGLSIVVSILRLTTFWRLNESVSETSDILYVAGTVGIYTIVETGGYLIAACALVFRQLKAILPARYFPRTCETNTKTKRSTGLLGPLTGGRGLTAKSKPSSNVSQMQRSNLGERMYGDTLPLTSLERELGETHTAFAGVASSAGNSMSSLKDGNTSNDHSPLRVPENAIKIRQEVDVTREES